VACPAERLHRLLGHCSARAARRAAAARLRRRRSPPSTWASVAERCEMRGPPGAQRRRSRQAFLDADRARRRAGRRATRRCRSIPGRGPRIQHRLEDLRITMVRARGDGVDPTADWWLVVPTEEVPAQHTDLADDTYRPRRVPLDEGGTEDIREDDEVAPPSRPADRTPSTRSSRRCGEAASSQEPVGEARASGRAWSTGRA
jgi:hypothetical protein